MSEWSNKSFLALANISAGGPIETERFAFIDSPPSNEERDRWSRFDKTLSRVSLPRDPHVDRRGNHRRSPKSMKVYMATTDCKTQLAMNADSNRRARFADLLPSPLVRGIRA